MSAKRSINPNLTISDRKALYYVAEGAYKQKCGEGLQSWDRRQKNLMAAMAAAEVSDKLCLFIGDFEFWISMEGECYHLEGF